MAADVNGNVYAWGNDSYGQLGNGPGQQDWDVPRKVHGVNDVGYLGDANFIVYVSAGRSGTHSLAVDSNGYVYAWGNNDNGQCGDGDDSSAQKNTPVLVLDDNPQTSGVYLGDIAHIIQVDAGENHSIALDADGRVWQWGANTTTWYYPEKVKASGVFGGQPLSYIVQISSLDHSVAVDANGYVWEWTASDGAYKVPGGEMGTTYLQNIVEASAGHQKSMARTTDGRVLEWDSGPSAYPEYVPDGQMQTQSGLLEGIIAINAGGYNAQTCNTRYKLAVSADGRGWAWGNNSFGQLDVGDTISRTEPAMMLCAGPSDSNGIIYVDKDATDGLNNGNSWDDAYLVFGDALYEAEILVFEGRDCQIWVAAGMYKPTIGPDGYSNATFKIPSGNIAIYGHFGGIGVYETSPEQRDFNNPAFETMLSGDFGSGQKAPYVVTCDDIGAGLLLDGFTITGSAAESYPYPGSGMLIENYSDPSIIRCTFKNNGFSGIYAKNFSYPDVADCQFLENDYWTVGIYSEHSTWPYVKNCVFDGNTKNQYALQGKYSNMLIDNCIIKRHSSNGMNFEYSYLIVVGCNIEDNSGNGINCSNSYFEVSGCTIKNNNNAGVYMISASFPTITNSAICLNKNNGIYARDIVNAMIKNNWIYLNGDDDSDSGVYLEYSNAPPFIRNNSIIRNYGYGIYISSGFAPVLTNDIIWLNGVNVFSERGLEDIEASYCCIEGGFPGIGNIDCDPCFRNPNADDYHLKDDSDCIDSGDPLADYESETDIDGRPRVIYERVDIGADEWFQAPDYNGDGIINFLDFAIFAQYWLADAPEISLDEDTDVDIDDLDLFVNFWLWSTYRSKADYNRDKVVNFHDFVVFSDAWLTENASISLDSDGDVDVDDLALFCQDWLWQFYWD